VRCSHSTSAAPIAEHGLRSDVLSLERRSFASGEHGSSQSGSQHTPARCGPDPLRPCSICLRTWCGALGDRRPLFVLQIIDVAPCGHVLSGYRTDACRARSTDRIGPDFDREKRDELKRMGRAYRCETEDYALLEDLLSHLIHPDHVDSQCCPNVERQRCDNDLISKR
jgi:hypothetical protein